MGGPGSVGGPGAGGGFSSAAPAGFGFSAARSGRTGAASCPSGDGKSFAEFDGTNRNDRNAFGKCVSAKARALNAQQEARLMNAAKACKTERAANREAFVARYGGRAASAFGRCVSSKNRQP